MKRALAVLALCLFGFVGFSQIAITGKWTGTVCVLPSVSLSSSLTLTYKVAGFDFTSITGFGASGMSSQAFGLKGALGPFTLTGDMWFSVSNVEYMGSRLSTSLDIAGLSVGLKILHWDTDYNDPLFKSATTWPYRPFYEYPILTESPCTQTGAFGMLYILTAKVDPVSFRASFVDCCDGIEFYDLYLWLDGVGLCCGISVDVEYYFTKAGFGYLYFSGINIPLCCGVSLDVGVTLEEAAKTLYVTPKFAGFAEACFTVWGNASFSGIDASTGAVTGTVVWSGIEIYGFSIKCTIADCNYIEFVEAFNVAEVNKKLASADRFITKSECTVDNAKKEDLLNEFELVKLGFCGAGCCGGKYDVTLRIFFGKGGGLFGVTRFGFTANIPVMSNFTLTISGSMPAKTYNCVKPSFCIGWTFTF